MATLWWRSWKRCRYCCIGEFGYLPDTLARCIYREPWGSMLYPWQLVKLNFDQRTYELRTDHRVIDVLALKLSDFVHNYGLLKYDEIQRCEFLLLTPLKPEDAEVPVRPRQWKPTSRFVPTSEAMHPPRPAHNGAFLNTMMISRPVTAEEMGEHIALVYTPQKYWDTSCCAGKGDCRLRYLYFDVTASRIKRHYLPFVFYYECGVRSKPFWVPSFCAAHWIIASPIFPLSYLIVESGFPNIRIMLRFVQVPSLRIIWLILNSNVPRHHDAFLTWQDILFAFILCCNRGNFRGSFSGFWIFSRSRSVRNRAILLGVTASCSKSSISRIDDHIENLYEQGPRSRNAAYDEDNPHFSATNSVSKMCHRAGTLRWRDENLRSPNVKICKLESYVGSSSEGA